MQEVDGSEDMEVVGHNSTLIIDPVTYKHQGTYMCWASNFIKDTERRIKSQAIRLEVTGKNLLLNRVHSENNNIISLFMYFDEYCWNNYNTRLNYLQ